MKPLPEITAEARPFWDGCRSGELRYQRCGSCGEAQFPPGTVCVHCHAADLSWRISSGEGAVYSFTVVERAPSADFRPDVPYIVALVDLAEGFRMMLNIRETPPEDVGIGMPVRIIFEDTAREDVKLPQARAA